MEHLTQSQVAALYAVSAADQRNHLMIRLAYEHGLRASEACSLQVSDFDSSTDIVYMTVQRLKNSMRTRQQLTPETAMLVRSAIANKKPHDYLFVGNRRSHHISRSMFWRLFQDYCRQAGIPEHLSHPHVAKHSIAMATIQGAGIHAVKQYLGHVSIRSTQQYLQIDDASATAAVQAVLAGRTVAWGETSLEVLQKELHQRATCACSRIDQTR